MRRVGEEPKKEIARRRFVRTAKKLSERGSRSRENVPEGEKCQGKAGHDSQTETVVATRRGGDKGIPRGRRRGSDDQKLKKEAHGRFCRGIRGEAREDFRGNARTARGREKRMFLGPQAQAREGGSEGRYRE